MPSLVGGKTARQAARRALDRRFENLRGFQQKAVVPRGGWVRAIREAIGMSAAQLAERMGATETSVLSLERNERSGRVRLDTLARAADALECDLVYALIPRQSLEDLVSRRAQELAAHQVQAVDHTMRLEGQRVDDATLREQLAEHASLLRDRPGFWRGE
jgi:predicted DNA-binding mobile mystery protein A